MPATSTPFAEMHLVPESVAKPWHGEDEVPRYLQLMKANADFNAAQAASVVSEARRTVKLRAAALVCLAFALGAAAGLVHWTAALGVLALVAIAAAAVVVKELAAWRRESKNLDELRYAASMETADAERGIRIVEKDSAAADTAAAE